MPLRFFEIARVLVRLDLIASLIVKCKSQQRVIGYRGVMEPF
jgi:hypothetical protein